MIHDYLPVCREDMDRRGWDACDFVYVSGDAYVDHPSFGPAIISRLLEARGYKVGIIAQPDWKNPESIQILGKPRLGFLVSAGNMDSMVNHYTVAKKHRKTDAFTPERGRRGDRAGDKAAAGQQGRESHYETFFRGQTAHLSSEYRFSRDFA